VTLSYRDFLTRYGSPLYVYELAEVRRAYATLRAALPMPSDLYYSVKANPHPLLVRELVALGCKPEASSSGELEVALAAAGDPAAILYTGPAKSRLEIELALRRGVRRFSVESPWDCAKVEAAAKRIGAVAEVLVRVNPEMSTRRTGLQMSGAVSQFGTDLNAITERSHAFESGGSVRVIGVHCYMGTNVMDVDALVEGFATALDSAVRAASALGISLQAIDLGGGFGHPFACRGMPCDIGALRPTLERLFDAYLPAWRHGEPRLSFESGRFLVAAAGTLIATVEDVKSSGGTRFVVLDTGINHLAGATSIGRTLRPEIEVMSLETGDLDPCRVAGPLCTPIDLLSSRARLPLGLKPGDPVWIPNVGAYGLSASLLAFLSRACPAELVLDEGIVREASRVEFGRIGLCL
jgi:diaminopimelate decarboxylase